MYGFNICLIARILIVYEMFLERVYIERKEV